MPLPSLGWLVGLDLGQASDFTAIAAMEVTRPRGESNQYAVRHLDRVTLGTSYPEIVRIVKDMLAQPALHDAILCVDQTGVGRPVVDMLRQAGLKATLRAITITGGHQVTRDTPDHSYHVPKKELVSALQILFQSQRIRISKAIPDCVALVKELQNFVKQAIAPYKYPRAIEFLPALPKTPTGKVQRHALRAREQAT